MSSEAKQLDAYVEAAADLLELPLEPDWLPSICANLEVTLVHGRNVLSLPLPNEAEPAFVYEV
ncbi:MAG: DUF4089 domain-containing protein [Proteobacteria bacterium]|nr:DUF4089 domain-containing protein [Pseudomonadota bacterium]